MIRKIINKWRNRYEQLYANKTWHLILDVGAIFLIIVLVVLWWIIRGSQWEINQKIVESLKPVKHQPIVYQELPMSWTVELERPVVDGAGSELVMQIKYISQAKHQIKFSYDCQMESGEKLVFSDSAESNFLIKDGALTGQIEPQASSTVRIKLIGPKDSQLRENKMLCQLAATVGQQIWQEPKKEFILKQAGLVKATAGAYYYTAEGDQVGIGPLPPIVGLPTSYLITWSIDNSGGDLSDLQFSAVLGEAATWQGEAGLTGGNLSYDSENRKINWRITAWPDDATLKQASFYVSINPNQEMVGQILTLTKAGQWKVDDAWAEKIWQGSLSELTTNLDQDSRSKGQGKVQDWSVE